MNLRSVRQWLAVFVVVLGSLLSGYYVFFIHPPEILTREDGAATWEERSRQLREALPDSVDQVGYISDNDPAAMVQEYSLIRYALAPVIVRQDTEHEWIIGNFTQPGFEEILKQKISSDFTIKKIGGGIFLIHRSQP